MKFEHAEVFNFKGALRGMRNPKASWILSDSYSEPFGGYIIGEKDMDLCRRLIKAGDEHCKFLRQIFVSVDITAPIYWWKEFDTYKVGTVSNSTSTMHKLTSNPIVKERFEVSDEKDVLGSSKVSEEFIGFLEKLRLNYVEEDNKEAWKELIRWLPESFLQTRTITMSYANLRNIYNQRCAKPHKLTEWSVDFKKFVLSLPYAKEFIVE